MWFRTATVSTSASTSELSRSARRVSRVVAFLALVLIGAAPAHAGLDLQSFRGHLSVGYGKLMNADAPGGSISFSGGIEYPIRPHWSAGVEIGYWLLGTRLVESGSLAAEVDYSEFETLALARWTTPRAPIEVAFGPGVIHAQADLTSAGPAGFSEFAVEETRAAGALSITAIQRRPAPVRVGVELAARAIWLPKDTWTLLAVRLSIHY